MSSNSFGRLLRVTTFGESHGPGIGAVVDGLPAGVPIDIDEVQAQLDRRRPGQSHLASARAEADRVELLSGLYEGLTTGAPLALLLRNEDARPRDYDALARVFRPGHADLTWQLKYGRRDPRGSGRASGRETAARVAAGAVARQLLAREGVSIGGHVIAIAGVTAPRYDSSTPGAFDPSAVEQNPVRCGDPEAAKAMTAAIEAAKADGDSVGGVVEIFAERVPAGLGDPVFGKLDAELAGALMSIGAVKGVEIGDGFALAALRGSQANDPLAPPANPGHPPGPRSNRAGGVLGGISSGAPLVARLAVKPTPTIAHEQRTVDIDGRPATVRGSGRHDPCIAPRLVPVAEAMLALVVADALLRQRALIPPGVREAE